MKLTDEAVEAAFREANRRLSNDELSMSDTRAILTEALPHLTDDGAALPSPHLRQAVESLAADWRSLPHDPDSVATTVLRHCGAQLASALYDNPAEGATPATTHRPTCGTTYGESCDGYCPTPAIDRRQIIRTLYDQGAYCGSCDYESHDWAVFDWTDCEDCKRVLGKYADAMLALIEGAQ